MADEELLLLLLAGVESWNAERPKGPVDLRWADLRAADLREANLSAANLSEADLIGANLSGAHLSVADLSEADLSVANLSEADLSEADLSGAHLIGAHLIGANLIGANLSEADLSAANLSAANLSAANLSAVNLGGADLMGVRYDEYTVWPEGFQPPSLEPRARPVRVAVMTDEDARELATRFEPVGRHLEQRLADPAFELDPTEEADALGYRAMLSAWERTNDRDPRLYELIVARLSPTLSRAVRTDPFPPDLTNDEQARVEAAQNRTADVLDQLEHLGDEDSNVDGEQLVELANEVESATDALEQAMPDLGGGGDDEPLDDDERTGSEPKGGHEGRVPLAAHVRDTGESIVEVIDQIGLTLAAIFGALNDAAARISPETKALFVRLKVLGFHLLWITALVRRFLGG
jgi:uncharacterized protein YjbI with pentapeptide repeats